MQDLSNQYIFFLQGHQEQLKRLQIPSNLHMDLYNKIVNQTFDAGEYFQFCEMPEGFAVEHSDRRTPYGLLCIKEEGMKKNSNIFIIEHHFMAEREEAMMTIAKNPQLLVEYEYLFGLDGEGVDPSIRLQRFYDLMWEYNSSLRLYNKDKNTEKCLWYLVDNVGMSITFSQTPNFKMIPFYFMPTEQFFTLLFPCEDIQFAELITCDYLNPLQLLPDEYSSIPLRNRYIEAQQVVDKLIDSYQPTELTPYGELKNSFEFTQQPYTGIPVRIYSQIDLIPKYLTIEPFKSTEDINNCDAMFLLQYLSDEKFNVLKGTRAYVDQFEGQRALTLKNELYNTMKTTYGKDYRKILPETYDMSDFDDAKEFVVNYFKREKEGKENYWIVKPCNDTHGKGIGIFNNISPIIKTANSIPCIVSKYITNPLLFNGKKFDLRFIILMKYDVMWQSAKPDIYLYNTFWTRFANNQFNLDDLTDYETHFTVMNYGHHLTKLLDKDFIIQFNEMFGDKCKWEEMQKKIELMLSRTFDAVIQSKFYKFEVSSCAIYGADIMIDDEFNPYLLEMNFQPDCTRACEYDNDFYNKVFSTFFNEVWDAKQIY